jgi:hypothetical protein
MIKSPEHLHVHRIKDTVSTSHNEEWHINCYFPLNGIKTVVLKICVHCCKPNEESLICWKQLKPL